jgi:uncharacterized protein YggE
MSEAADVPEVRPAAAGGFRGWPVPPAVVAAAAAALALLVAVVAAAVAVSARSSGSGLGATVVPPRADVTASQQAGSTADSKTASAAGAAAPASAQAQGTTSVPVTAPSCAAAPTVQLQGRGLVVTGVAPVAPGATPTTALTVTVQERGGDAAAVLGAVQARSQAVLAALKQAGVPDSDVQQTSFSSFGDLQGRQFTAYATIQARVEGADRLAQATRAVAQVPGISGYSAGSAQAAQPSPDEVQAAVTGAASQARDMAVSTARAAGVTLGAVQGVTTQPPTLCYGPGGPARIVQVTLTYALKWTPG